MKLFTNIVQIQLQASDYWVWIYDLRHTENQKTCVLSLRKVRKRNSCHITQLMTKDCISVEVINHTWGQTTEPRWVARRIFKVKFWVVTYKVKRKTVHERVVWGEEERTEERINSEVPWKHGLKAWRELRDFWDVGREPHRSILCWVERKRLFDDLLTVVVSIIKLNILTIDIHCFETTVAESFWDDF